ncbi:MAG TPA: phosphoribosylanthranilate isomerase [Planctomycetes bacterium]|nr:phosphoribosylanthranilate isomerase [Planctomycetota bacterium]
MVKVKICGLTNLDDAQAAINLGADMLGFNFYPKSPRYISPVKAAEVIKRLPGFISVVGVFVNTDPDQIRKTIRSCQLDWVQFHGDETIQFCQGFISESVRTMKAIRVKTPEDVTKAQTYYTDAILLDAFSSEQYGGTGESFDWNIIGHIGKRVFLAGGINPDNASEAVKLGVYGIDVCSGVEAEPGKKDHDKMKTLFEKIRLLRG